jgi:hypothetical protein
MPVHCLKLGIGQLNGPFAFVTLLYQLNSTDVHVSIWRDVYALPAHVIPEHRDHVIQVDPWEKAADCERALRVTFDPLNRKPAQGYPGFWFHWSMQGRS